MAILLITHDLGVVAEMVDDVAVMYARQDRRARPRQGDLRRPAAPVHRGAAPLDPAPRDALHDAAEGDPRHGAEPARLAARLPLRAALRLRLRPLRARSCRRSSTSARRSRPAGCASTAARDGPRVGGDVSVDDGARTASRRAGPVAADDGRRLHPPPHARAEEVLPRQAGLPQADVRPPAGRRRRRPRRPPRRDARPRRRVRLRQVDARADDPAAARADRGRDRVRRRRPRRPRPQRDEGRCAGTCRSSSRTRSARSTRA